MVRIRCRVRHLRAVAGEHPGYGDRSPDVHVPGCGAGGGADRQGRVVVGDGHRRVRDRSHPVEPRCDELTGAVPQHDSVRRRHRRAGVVRLARADAEADRLMGADTRLPSIVTAATPRRIITFVAVLLIALFLLPAVLSAYWMKIMFEMAAYSLVTLGLGLLVGRTGMYSLCQIPMVAAGAWFALRVLYLFDGALYPFHLLATA